MFILPTGVQIENVRGRKHCQGRNPGGLYGGCHGDGLPAHLAALCRICTVCDLRPEPLH